MFKKFMIGLFALSVAAIWVSEAHAWGVRLQRGVLVYYEDLGSIINQTGETFDTGIYGLSAVGDCGCGEVRGKVYCAANDTPDARDACLAATGDSPLLLILDPEAIPEWLDPDQYNFNIKEQGQRAELLYFADNFPPPPSQPPVRISLPAGTMKKPGWFAIEDPNFEPQLYVGTWNNSLGKFVPADGYGVNGNDYIEKVPLKSYYGGDNDNIHDLVDQYVCVVWHHDNIKGETLIGNNYGVAAFYTHSFDSTSNTMEVEILSAYDICREVLRTNVNAELAGTENECQVDEAVVFAPAPIEYNGKIHPEVRAFPEASGTINCNENEEGTYDCYGTAEIQLNPDIGNKLCKYFVDFTPINSTCQAVSFTGYMTSSFHNDEVKCSEAFIPGGDSTFSQYACNDLTSTETLPDCFACGQNSWKYGESVSCDDCPF